MEIGEEYKDYALKWDAIAPDIIETVWGYGFDENMAKKLMDKLTAQSIERRKTLDEFRILEERINWVKQRQEKKEWSFYRHMKISCSQSKTDCFLHDIFYVNLFITIGTIGSIGSIPIVTVE